jgi:hypothetical protein
VSTRTEPGARPGLVARGRRQRRGALLAVAASAAAALLLSGCGSSSTFQGGFSASDYTAGQKALATLAQTSVYDAALEITLTAAEDPTACVLHIENHNPLTFKLFMTWIPNPKNLGGTVKQQAAARTWSWIQAVIGPQGLQGDYSFHEGNELSLGALQARYGDAFSQPVEKCLLLQNEAFGLLPPPGT